MSESKPISAATHQYTSPTKDDFMRPFEWLTDAPSVIPLIESVLSSLPDASRHDTSRLPPRILHVGSGSSVLGESLVETLGDRIAQVVNVDRDGETLQKMETQWKLKHNNSDNDDTITSKLQFVPVDFAATSSGQPPISFPAGHFHVAMDKSTLDCTLCSDSATAGLLSEVYRLLHPRGGTYICISFHHVDLLRPLLEDLPGADWDVSHQTMNRHVEDLIGINNNTRHGTLRGNQSELPPPQPTANNEIDKEKGSNGTWASGTFEPDEQYRRTVNVMICRRRGDSDDLTNNVLDRDALVEHVNNTNDTWFQEHNPMLTAKRKEDIQRLFQEHVTTTTNTTTASHHDDDDDNNLQLVCDVEVGYTIIFTEEEREHFTYDLFLEDWDAWMPKKRNPSFSKDKMSLAMALEFLEEMQ